MPRSKIYAIDADHDTDKIMPMKELVPPIGKVRREFCRLVKKVQAGDCVTITSHGPPCARLVPLEKSKNVWRVEKPDDPKLFGDLQSPVMENWK